jgi:hypothetical protein
MAIKTFSSGEVLTASDTNTYLNNGGLVYITETLVTAGSATSVSFNNVFTSTYDNYQIVIDGFTPSIGGRGLNLRLRVGGVDAAGATDYPNAFLGLTAAGVASNFSTTGDSYGSTGIYSSSTTIPYGSSTITMFNPARAVRTFANVHGQLFDAQLFHRTGSFQHNLATAYDGFTLFMSSTGNITTLRVRVYGYRQA